jgi:hypothetical protein
MRLFAKRPAISRRRGSKENIENNPMQSSRRLPQPAVRKLDMSGKSAAQLHHPGIRWTMAYAQHGCDHVARGSTVEEAQPPLALTCGNRENTGCFRTFQGIPRR